MPTSPHLQLSALPRPHDFEPSLADVVASTSVLSLTSSTPSPPDSPNLDVSIANRIPPELLLDIFSIVSDSPSRDYPIYLERNRNLKSFALVHSSWGNPAKEILQEEVFLCGINVKKQKSVEEPNRMPGSLVDSGNSGTKFLTIGGYLNDVTNGTGFKIWRQVRYLRLLAGSRSEDTSSMRDFVRFPQLEHLHLDQDNNGDTFWMKIYPSDSQLQFLNLRRITFSPETYLIAGTPSGGLDTQQSRASFFSIAHKLFSPSNMPNLRHLAISDENIEALDPILHQIITLAIGSEYGSAAEVIADHHTIDNLKHLSLAGFPSTVKKLLDHNNVELESLHLASWMVADDKELLARLLKIAKGEHAHNRIGRIVFYGSREEVEAEFHRPADDLDAFEWREDRDYSPYADFDGR